MKIPKPLNSLKDSLSQIKLIRSSIPDVPFLDGNAWGRPLRSSLVQLLAEGEVNTKRSTPGLKPEMNRQIYDIRFLVSTNKCTKQIIECARKMAPGAVMWW